MDQLKRIMHEFCIKKKDLENITGMTRQTIHNYINGKTEPDVCFICKLADYCGCSVDYLLGRSRYVNEKELVGYTIQNCITALYEFKKEKDNEKSDICTS